MYVTIDTETELIERGNVTPRLVLYQEQVAESKRSVGPVSYRTRAQQPSARLREHLRARYEIIGHNVAFDLGVLVAEDPSLLRPIFNAYSRGRVHDTMLRDQLLEIASGRFASLYRARAFNLADTAHRYLDKRLDKSADTFRYSFGQWLEAETIADFEPSAIKYAKNDVIATRQIFFKQAHRAQRYFDHNSPPDEALQTGAAWALHLMGSWGLRTDKRMLSKLRAEWSVKHAKATREMQAKGLLRPNGARNMKAIQDRIVAVLGKDTPRTPTGRVSTDAETIDLIGDSDPVLGSMVLRNRAEKLISTYLDAYLEGTEHAMCPSWNTLVETGRTSCRNSNMQNVPRLFGVREAVIPREGFYFIRADYAQSELVSLAYVCLQMVGWSKMADALQVGLDLHLMLAASIVGCSYQEAEKWIAKYKAGSSEKHAKAIQEARQIAKVANFGFPGGLGAKAFVAYYRNFQRDNPALPNLSEAHAIRLKRAWLKTWPEMRDYFNVIADLTSDLGPKKIVQDMSGRVRAQVTFTEASNGMFQGKTADGAKDALFHVSRACYVEKDSHLYGSRPVLFIHDEIVAESPIEVAHEAAEALARRMAERMSEHVPGMPVRCDAAIMARWYKGAEPVRDRSGKLIPWAPRQAA